MKHNNHLQAGFTLLELLVAASIVAILLLFATTAYRNSVAETRAANARAKTRAIAGAYQRFKVEHPGIKLNGELAQLDTSSGSPNTGCRISSGASPEPVILIQCGYLENQRWYDGYFSYTVGSADDKTLACAKAADKAKLGVLKGKTFCVKEDGTENDNF